MSDANYRIVYTPDARDDLDDIYSYIAFSLSERQTAIKLTRRIRNEIRALNPFAESCEVVDFEPWKELGIRRLPVGNFNVYYLADTEAHVITIIRIFYGGRDIENIISKTI